MQSSYISVREKYLKLLGTAASAYPKLLLLYYPILLRGCNDKGISVRKASFRLVRDLVMECLRQYQQQYTLSQSEHEKGMKERNQFHPSCD